MADEFRQNAVCVRPEWLTFLMAEFEEFEKLLNLEPDMPAEDSKEMSGKMCPDADAIKDMTFADDFQKGLNVGDLTRSIEQEFRENDGGKWWFEYDYVVNSAAIAVNENNKADKAADFEKIGLKKGNIKRRDEGHDGWRLDDFWKKAPVALTRAEVAALRLYTGPAYQALNGALRSGDAATNEWKTTIACCYSGIIKLGQQGAKAERVYRGVKETTVKLPDKLLNSNAQMSGVELAFSSTTKDRSVAVSYKGKAAGTIFAINFNATTKAGALDFLSQFPHEVEFLFPPKSMLDVKAHSMYGNTRLIYAEMIMSNSLPDTTAITGPDIAPLYEKWRTINRGTPFPHDAVLGGAAIGEDGDCYIGRHEGHPGKMNMESKNLGVMYNCWVEGFKETPWKAGQILITNKECKWVSYKGYKVHAPPKGYVLAGKSDKGTPMIVARNKRHEPGKLYLEDGKMGNLWCHKDGKATEYEVLVLEDKVRKDWIKY